MDFSALIPVAGILSGVAIIWIGYKYQELKVLGRRASEKAAAEAAEKKQLQQRLAVLERIVTDRGVQTADQIEALRHGETA
jgi:hypothetical protein